MASLKISLFGALTVQNTVADGREILLPTRKSEALLAYLVENADTPVPRELLADMLWPYSGEDQARASLRQEVSVLRKAFGDHGNRIVSKADRLIFDTTDALIDVSWLKASATQQAPVEPQNQIELLRLYKAPFLDGFRINSQGFSDWLWTTRQAHEALAIRIGSSVIGLERRHDTLHMIEDAAVHLCRIDPTFEAAHQCLIELYLARGEADLARRQLEACRDALNLHLDAGPGPETAALSEKINTALAISSAPQAELSDAQMPSAPQRRHLTFLSVLGNSASTDPEELEKTNVDFAERVGAIIASRTGQVISEYGGRILAVFGYPSSTERDPDAALRTAYDILAVGPTRSMDFSTCKIGLAHGLALISETPEPTHAIPKISSGAALAAETLAHLADSGEIWTNGATRAVMTHRSAIKRVEIAPDTFRVRPKAEPAAEPIRAAFQRRLYPTVGRDIPLAQLQSRLLNAKAGEGSATVIYGGPGEGKSRLILDLLDHAEDEAFEIRVFQGDQIERQATFAPLINQMSRSCAFNGSNKCDLTQALNVWLQQEAPSLLPARDYFAALLGSRALQDDQASIPQQIKELALDIFAALARSATLSRPFLMVFEDCHWFDATTCAALYRLIEAVQAAPVLVVFTARTGEAPHALQHPQVQDIQLAPLDHHSASALLHGLLGDKPVSQPHLALALDKAMGNPLVLEEFAKLLLDHRPEPAEITPGNQPDMTGKGLPQRLLSLLLSQIDSIPGAIPVLQQASVFGRRFSLSSLNKMLAPRKLRVPLFEELEDKGIVYSTDPGGRGAYIFKHVLIAEAIYATIPLRNRRELHAAAAEALITQGERISHSEVALHFQRAGMHAPAAHHFELSGDGAMRVAAHAEAIAEYANALTMVEHLPLSEERLRLELSLNRKIAAQLIGLHGIPTSDAIPHYEAVRSLSIELADEQEYANAAWGLWSIHLMVAELDDCLEIAENLLESTPPGAAQNTHLIAHYMLGVTEAYRGAFSRAIDHLECVRDLYSEQQCDDLRSRFGMNIGLTSDSFLAWVHALTGHETRANAATDRALIYANKSQVGLDAVFANVFAATKCLFLDQTDAAHGFATTALARAEAMGYPQWVAQSKIQLARIADLSGASDSASQMQDALDEYLATGMVLARPYAQVWIAEAHMRQGRTTEALEQIKSLEGFMDATGERYFGQAASAIRARASQVAAPDV